jgi:hypothetical protein
MVRLWTYIKFDWFAACRPSTHKMKVLTLIALFTSAYAAQPYVQSCGGLLNVTDVEMRPKSPQPGEDLTLILTIRNGFKKVETGLSFYSLTTNEQPEVPQVDYLCDLVSCPIRFGNSKQRLDLYVPDFQGSGTVRLELATNSLEPLVCLDIKISKHSWLRSFFHFGERIPMIAPPAEPLALPAPRFATSKPLLNIDDSFALSHE